MLSSWTTLFLLAPSFLAGTVGCALMLSAGTEYTSGRLARGRRRGRHGGWLLFAGGIALAVAVTLLALGGVALPGAAALPGAVLAGAAGVTGLLGGLSGKPRPADGFATALLTAAAACLAMAA